MDREIEFDALLITANNHSDCAHGCRYCPIRRKNSPIALERYQAFVERVKQWLSETHSRLPLLHGLGYHTNYDRADLETLHRLNGDPAIRGITLGGLPSRNDDQLRAWLSLLREYGLESVHATFAGAGAVHDRWNNRPRNFDLLLRTLRAAGALGMSLGQRLLIGQSTLPEVESLLDELETLPKHEGDWRYAMPFFYQTAQQKAQPHVEQDRIDEAIRDRMSDRLRGLFIAPHPTNLSEREWIQHTRDKAHSPDKVSLIIRLTAENIDRLERTPIGSVVSALEEETRIAYQAMPSFHALLERYGDTSNTKIYAIERCIEMKWLDRYRAESRSVSFDQSLTHCWFGA